MAFVDYSKIVPMHLVKFFVKLRATVSFPPLSRGLVLDARKIDYAHNMMVEMGKEIHEIPARVVSILILMQRLNTECDFKRNNHNKFTSE